MKRFRIIMVLAVLTLSAGCHLTSQERYNLYQEQLKAVQLASEQTGQILNDLKIEVEKYPDSEELKAKLAKAEEVKAEIDKKLAEYEERLSKIDAEAPGADLQAVGAGLQTAAPLIPPPWGALIGVAGTVLAGIGGASAHESKKKYKAHKIGVEKAKLDLPAETGKIIYEAIGTARKDLGVK